MVSYSDIYPILNQHGKFLRDYNPKEDPNQEKLARAHKEICSLKSKFATDTFLRSNEDLRYRLLKLENQLAEKNELH